MGEVIKNYKIVDNIITFKNTQELDEGYFKKNISFLYMPEKKSTKNWDDEEWDKWFKENAKRRNSSKIYFDQKIKKISSGAFENWSAEKIEFRNGIDLIESEAIFGGNVKSILVYGGIKKISSGNFSNMIRKDDLLDTESKGLDFIVDGNIGVIGEGTFSDSIYRSLQFKGAIGKINDYDSYLVPSFSNLVTYFINIPEGMKNLGKGNFMHSRFGYATLPSSLDRIDESTFVDTLVDILVVHSMELNLENRSIHYPYKNLVLETNAKPIIIGYKGSKIEKYAKNRGYNFEEIVSLEKEVTYLDESVYICDYKLSLNKNIKEFEKDYRLEYDLLIIKDIKNELNILDIKYKKLDKLNIELEDNKLNIYLEKGYSFREEEFGLKIKYKNDKDWNRKKKTIKIQTIRKPLIKNE